MQINESLSIECCLNKIDPRTRGSSSFDLKFNGYDEENVSVRKCTKIFLSIYLNIWI